MDQRQADCDSPDEYDRFIFQIWQKNRKTLAFRLSGKKVINPAERRGNLPGAARFQRLNLALKMIDATCTFDQGMFQSLDFGTLPSQFTFEFQ